MILSDHNSLIQDTNLSQLPPKIQANDHIFSEKPNYTTAKFFEQASDPKRDQSHQRMQSYRTEDHDQGLSDKSILS